jgi:hypothetical protein
LDWLSSVAAMAGAAAASHAIASITVIRFIVRFS